MSVGLRKRTVAVAIIYDKNSDSYLLWNNMKWHGYTFPMKQFKAASVADTGKIALDAIDGRDFPLSLRNATAGELDLQRHMERSASTGEVTGYEYHVYGIDPGQPIRTIVGDPNLRWFPYAKLKKARNVTPSTKQIVKTLVKERKVAVAVISRQARRGREFLMVWKGSRYKYFFPCTRMKTERSPAKAAIRAVRDDLGYRGAVNVAAHAEVDAKQVSFRFGPHLGRFTFHPCMIHLSSGGDEAAKARDLEQSLNGKQAALARLNELPGSGQYWGWFTEKELRMRRDMSPSMKDVLLTVLQLAEKNS
jgi:hypothetical protein